MARVFGVTSWLTVAWLAAGAAGAAAAELSSPSLVKELVTLMGERKLTSIAAADPETPERFVAAMVYPEVQLLVMGAKHGSPDYVQALLAHRRYEDVYVSLQQGETESKLFFQDLGADGLHHREEQIADVMYEKGNQQTLLDGNWRGQKLSESAYRKKLEDADAQYSRMLKVLIAAVKALPQGTAAGG